MKSARRPRYAKPWCSHSTAQGGKTADHSSGLHSGRSLRAGKHGGLGGCDDCADENHGRCHGERHEGDAPEHRLMDGLAVVIADARDDSQHKGDGASERQNCVHHTLLTLTTNTLCLWWVVTGGVKKSDAAAKKPDHERPEGDKREVFDESSGDCVHLSLPKRIDVPALVLVITENVIDQAIYGVGQKANEQQGGYGGCHWSALSDSTSAIEGTGAEVLSASRNSRRSLSLIAAWGRGRRLRGHFENAQLRRICKSVMAHLLRRLVGGLRSALVFHKLGPDQLPVIRPKITPSNAAIGGSLDGYAVLRRGAPIGVRVAPLIHLGNVCHTDSSSQLCGCHSAGGVDVLV